MRTEAAPGPGNFKVLYRFTKQSGEHPYSGVINVNGTLYGTTYFGGTNDNGTVYKITTSGDQKVVYRFQGGSDGANPQGDLLDVNGTLYGTTVNGGNGSACTGGCGTVFKISPSGKESVLHSFSDSPDGANPSARLINVDGALYGSTAAGGPTNSGCAPNGCGTIFKITTSGSESILHEFEGHADGAFPISGLTEAGGKLYGTTLEGGAGTDCTGGCGTVFSITTAGQLAQLYSFRGGDDGSLPDGGLLAVSGALYGTTAAGGSGGGCQFGCGTIFSLTTAGEEKVLHMFRHIPDGAEPVADLINVNGTLYGTTALGGHDNDGVVFRLTPSGSFGVMHSFQGKQDGAFPYAKVTALDGALYGTTGGDGQGTVYRVTP